MTLELSDGRSLDVRVSGPDGGLPLVFHHGTPGSVLPYRAIERAVHGRGWRLVTYSRAGYGASTRRPGRSVADVVPDIAAILDHLGADRCVTAGWSGGGPHALACAALLGDRVRGALCLAGVAPWDAEGLDYLAGMGSDNIEEFGLAVEGEAALRTMLVGAAEELAHVETAGIVGEMSTLLPQVDVAQLTGEFGDDLAANFREATRTGADGWVDDDLAFVRPWGFELAAISVPTFVWQGSEDLMVPFAHGQWLAGHVPGTTAHLEHGEGHLSITLGAIEGMLDELVSTV